ncbi:hypothetical protein SteCoe_28372 [Stentor coeruleus]|uniref:Peptidase A1 domain-containing protein n=1 Tax=Stentor coeruleus TaxID=5963 RepID=A0A1R2B8C9_9CILI|nr:hypothetical protein SteCoe_28372 [Stentor coeruleus]
MIFSLCLIVVPSLALLTVPLTPSSKSYTNNSNTVESSTLTPEDFRIYYSIVLTKGTPGKNISLVLDTASAWLLYFKSDNISESSTETCYNNSTSLIYENYEFIGNLCSDKFKADELMANSQVYVEVSRQDAVFASCDGVLGLAFSRLAHGFWPFVSTLKKEGKIKEQIFSIYLGNQSYSQNYPVMTIGGFSDDYCIGEERIIPVSSYEGHWMIDIESLGLGSDTTGFTGKGIFDSTFDAISLPENTYNTLISIFSQNDYNDNISYPYSFPCDYQKIHSLQNLTLFISEHEYLITPNNYLKIQEDFCILRVTKSQNNYIRLGLPFFREYYLIFDYEVPEILSYKAADPEKALKFNTLYIVGIIVLGVIIIIPLCFYVMLSKVQGVASEPLSYEKIPN